VRRLRWPVVSIGNLSTGGAGKTPLTIALAKALTARGLHVDVLSRGYGRRSALPLTVDPEGTAEEFGDEPLVIAREAGVDVYVAAERYEAGLMAEAAQPAASNPVMHILDDGFQHRRLVRDVDILLLSQRDLTDGLLPAGNLREPLNAFHRATVLAISANESAVEDYLHETILIDRNSEIQRWIGPTWRIHRHMDVPPIAGPVAAFCGIARPEQFFAGLESARVHVASRTVFADHHRYVQHDVDCLLDAARNVGATAFITTEKDCARLGQLGATIAAVLPLKTAQLRIEIEDEQSAVDWLIARCSAVMPGSSRE
jgi:tetraacyldisaccharide 4'-kinase